MNIYTYIADCQQKNMFLTSNFLLTVLSLVLSAIQYLLYSTQILAYAQFYEKLLPLIKTYSLNSNVMSDIFKIYQSLHLTDEYMLIEI